MQAFHNFINLFPSATFPLMLAAFGLPALQQKLHHLLKIQSGKTKILLSGLLSLSLASLPVALGFLHENLKVLGGYTALVFTIISYVYQFLIKETPSVAIDLGMAVPAPQLVVAPIVASPLVSKPPVDPATEQLGA
jgi:hypothetical protein